MSESESHNEGKSESGESEQWLSPKTARYCTQFLCISWLYQMAKMITVLVLYTREGYCGLPIAWCLMDAMLSAYQFMHYSGFVEGNTHMSVCYFVSYLIWYILGVVSVVESTCPPTLHEFLKAIFIINGVTQMLTFIWIITSSMLNSMDTTNRRIARRIYTLPIVNRIFIQHNVLYWKYGAQHTRFTICTICNKNYGANARMASLECGHAYHDHCIISLLDKRLPCPTCPASSVPSTPADDTGNEIIGDSSV
ncbi:MAG: hypothetical protein Faunusvirus2_12 [Faunusvirus sp.]|uniref:RING-type domain-containing protein n=1 Tax=Faunusvirus sp. TaxID=2487766 RepID=A0A3G4ZVZ7_9VIRU|nr:MAG: hypothetical protein Faunusvirus2_12 [Faunusvirus sp.]